MDVETVAESHGLVLSQPEGANLRADGFAYWRLGPVAKDNATDLGVLISDSKALDPRTVLHYQRLSCSFNSQRTICRGRHSISFNRFSGNIEVRRVILREELFNTWSANIIFYLVRELSY